MDFIPAPADPERQRALPDAPGACPRCGARAWRRNGTYPRHLVVLGRLRIQRWQCKACRGSASPLPPGVTSRQRPQTLRELMVDLYVHCTGLRGLSRLLALLGCGLGGRHPVAGRAGGGARSGARPAGAAAVVGRGGRDLAVPRGRQAARGPGAGGRTAGPAPGRARLRRGRLVHGPSRTRGAGADDRPRPGPDPAPGHRAWTGSSVPCTCSAPWDGTSWASTRTTRPTP